uniref:Glutamate decarboxylase like 1 n=1 Tax=Neogobius melanostomus TaxID=47308 RepID=A0A8C6S5E5_9GOBI
MWWGLEIQVKEKAHILISAAVRARASQLEGPGFNSHQGPGLSVWSLHVLLVSVCEWVFPEQLQQLLDLDLRDTGESEEALLRRCSDVIKYSVKTGHPRFFNQLYAGMEPYSTVGSFITEAIKTSLYTYEVAPVFTLVEQAVLKKMIEVIGWEDGDGTFNPGGSMSNMYALNLARYRHSPDIKENGLFGVKRQVIFTSQDAHYSLSKGAAFLGIGTKNICTVPTDERGRMVPSALEELILKSAEPIMVNATAGTTVIGAFDPIDQIADVCEKYGLWLHVDACWGGAVLLSERHKHLVKGIDRADSVAWNPHKMLMACLQCSGFLVRDKTHLLQRCHSARASYLFQQDKFYDVSFDCGDKSIQCSRKPDAFKIWLLWKALGTSQLEQRVDRALPAKPMKFFLLFFFFCLFQPEYANVCFWYIPPSLRSLPDGPELWEKIHKVAPVIKERMMKKGNMMLGYQMYQDKANFFRMVIINPDVGTDDLHFVLEETHRLGKDL